MATIKILLLCFVITAGYGLHSNFMTNTKGAKVFRVILKDKKQLNFLKQQYESDTCDFWSFPTTKGAPVDMMVTEWMVPVFENMFKKHGIPYDIHIEDVETAIKNSVRANEAMLWKSDGTMSWDAFQSYEMISEWLDELPSKYSFVNVTNIGKTFEKRDLKLVKISASEDDNSKKSSIWIDGGMQGRDWIGPATVTYLINELTSQRTAFSSLMKHWDIYLVPVANPDGYEYSKSKTRLWKKNRFDAALQTGCIGIDLNRNWGFHWNEVEENDNPCSGSYPGKSAFSEPETKSLSREMMTLSPNLKVYMSLTAFGQTWDTPWSYTSEEPIHDSLELSALCQVAVRNIYEVNFTKYKCGNVLKYQFPMSGTSQDWAKGVNGVKFSYEVSLPDQGEAGFLLGPKRIQGVGQETTQALRAILETVDDKFFAKKPKRDEL